MDARGAGHRLETPKYLKPEPAFRLSRPKEQCAPATRLGHERLLHVTDCSDMHCTCVTSPYIVNGSCLNAKTVFSSTSALLEGSPGIRHTISALTHRPTSLLNWRAAWHVSSSRESSSSFANEQRRPSSQQRVGDRNSLRERHHCACRLTFFRNVDRSHVWRWISALEHVQRVESVAESNEGQRAGSWPPFSNMRRAMLLLIRPLG
jgi:hypothetical protein